MQAIVTDHDADRGGPSQHRYRRSVSATSKLPFSMEGFFHGLSQEDWEKVQMWNQLPSWPMPTCVHDLFNEQERLRQGSLAIHACDGDLTYGELGRLSSTLGRYLVSQKIGREIFILLCFEKSLWAVVGMLAVLKAGAACVFLDPSHPAERNQIIANEVGASILLTSPSTRSGGLRELSIIEVDEAFIRKLDLESLPMLPIVRPEDAAIGLFTSGSTGKPKGIIQQHCTAAFSAQNCAQVFGISPGSRVMQWAAYCFDMSVIDMLMTLCAGACLCIPSEADRMDRQTETMIIMEVEIAAMTPSVAQVLKDKWLPHLKTLIFGGEALTRDHLEGWPSAIRIINAYGPAEGSESKDQSSLQHCADSF